MAACGKYNFCLFAKHKIALFSIINRSLRRIPVPDFDLSLEEKLKEMNAKDPILHAKVDIGFSVPKPSQLETAKQKKLMKKHMMDREQLAASARTRTLKISLDEVREEWKKSVGPSQIKKLAEHYGIYNDLFEYGYFIPHVVMNIAFEYDDDLQTPVYYGNIINPSEASKAPSVVFESTPNDLWTLVLTNLDGHLTDSNSEYLHWFIGNIKGNNILSGEVICDYLQPFPPRGTGYHRLVFILYKQEAIVDYSKLKKKLPWYTQIIYRYLDRYRDPKDIRKEVILKRLKGLMPFEEEPPPPKYPNIYKNPPNTPSWMRSEIWKERNRLGKYRDLRPYTSYPEVIETFYKKRDGCS
ncbi:39S ribosomal protein L38, mitochondrial-like [Centruroides sculpturatus]|uniref:39S ribosomal protein L38, mitochondrial-like n=1 Tax=Centruroides sculpturatus TaxID=218467 RepID=UPI000C6CC6F1|nr:39S ribosomal protein L38, mitochondrial-like [Centruroides sculpturatus]